MRRSRAWLIAAFACTSGCASAQGTPPAAMRPVATGLQTYIDSVIGDQKYRSATWGALVVDAASHDTLYSRNAGKLFVPASNQKIVTAAVALRELGSSFRFSTRFAHSGTVTDSVLNGDLIVFGSGDPSFSDRIRGDAMAPLREMADSLRAKGITVINGSLRRGAPRFTDSPIGPGWEWEDLSAAYGATVGDLMFNEAFAAVYTQIDGIPDSAKTAPVRRYRNFLDAFHAALRERGIAVPAGSDWSRTAADSALTTLFFYESAPLAELMPFFLKPSQNQIGEVLLKTIGFSRTGVGTADSGAAVVKRTLIELGADSLSFVVRDGSGLSRHDLLSPDVVIRLLDVVHSDSGFANFYASLPVAGVDGTMERRLRGSPAAGNVHAKTGSMDRVRSVSGYVTGADGRLLMFSFMVNAFATPGTDVDKSLDALMIRLATHPSGG